ncbi:sterol desaturase family [Lecanosticta acicola]|uniref:Sterol desaturase family n=1 Tax=Lecanosticta acicola TaxID=111012 RepID=A0AAI8Z050_9PEZI|nr:sterol desaturase family [Lecanosticta acicola]
MDALRERLVYGSGYLQGRLFALPRSLSDLYGFVAAKGTRLVTLPLPLLSFLAIPLYGGSSTTVTLLSFYFAWTALVFSHDPLTLELYGIVLARLFCFLLPALGLLAFDCAAPNLSKVVKSRGERQLPGRVGTKKLANVVGTAVLNVLLAAALQLALEQFVTKLLHLKSLLKVTTAVPAPLNILKQVLAGLVLRGMCHYAIHRYLLHTWNSALKTWHLSWQHSIPLPFSVVAAYDHPVNYLLASWLPTVLPAYLFRWHVLTFTILQVLCSLEELFVFSGYSVLPSAIILAGMARRVDAHFNSVEDGKSPGNFGPLGVLDFLLGTSCREETTVVDDIQDEVEQRNFQERVEEAVRAVMDNMKDENAGRNDESGKKTEKRRREFQGHHEKAVEKSSEDDEKSERGLEDHEQDEEPATTAALRRSGRSGTRRGRG